MGAGIYSKDLERLNFQGSDNQPGANAGHFAPCQQRRWKLSLGPSVGRRYVTKQLVEFSRRGTVCGFKVSTSTGKYILFAQALISRLLAISARRVAQLNHLINGCGRVIWIVTVRVVGRLHNYVITPSKAQYILGAVMTLD